MKFFFVALFFMSVSVFSQYKYEREYSVDADKVPVKAKSFIDKCKFDKKVKWFAEESQDGKTWEAKSCKNSCKYSVEFTKDGNVLDVEKTVKFSKLSHKEQLLINSVLKKEFIKFKLKKVQLQFTGTKNKLVEVIQQKNMSKYNFEMVVKGKTKSGYKLYEFLINSKGEIIKKLQFAPANTDNLEF